MDDGARPAASDLRPGDRMPVLTARRAVPSRHDGRAARLWGAARGAVILSCALLHAVSRVTAGRRYAFLPFLHDGAAASIRVPTAAGGRA